MTLSLVLGRIINTIAGVTAGQSLNHRVFNSLCMVAGLAFAIAAVFCQLGGLDPAVTALVGGIAALYFVGYYLSRFLNLVRFVFLPALIFAVISLGVLWFVSGGLEGSVPFMFILAAVILIAVVDGRYSLLAGLCVVAGFVAVVVLEAWFPDWVIPYPSLAVRRADLIFTALLSIGVVVVVIGLLRRNYEVERRSAELASQTRTEFLSTMSHEIRTPMNSVVGMTYLLLDENPRPDQMENLRLLQFSAQNLLVLLNDILDLSKIEAGKIEFEAAPFAPRELLQNIHALLLPEASKKDLSFDLIFPENIPEFIEGDSTRLGQVLMNLAANAIKFTERGGVRIELTSEVQHGTQDLNILFSVKDTGIGIDQKNLSEIFDSFSQASSSTTRRYGGTGLGLTISRRLLELMGSEILVESEIGMGSRFYFELVTRIVEGPKNIRHTVEPDALRSASKTNYRNDGSRSDLIRFHDRRVLLVDDFEPNIMLAQKFLLKWGLEVDTAADGQEALKKYEAVAYDLILMDLQMPVMNGFEATRAIRSMTGEGPQVPIIALSAAALPEEMARARSAGVSDYVTKPFNPRDLHAKIARALNVS